ncbi:MAG: DUF4062 domain-containing protein, partial [Ignavibacteria bacterium]|nr:DUF4062 domain-containing protein [Ignavibacteria bacterium]
MKKINIFLSSSMTGELDKERGAVKGIFSKGSNLSTLFELQHIEKNASPKKIKDKYLELIGDCEIFLLIIDDELRV